MKSYAKKIVKEKPGLKECTIAVVDSDLALVIQVCDLEKNVVAQYDTGDDGDDDPTEANEWAAALVKELNALGVAATLEE